MGRVPVYDYIILAVGFLVWVMPFFLLKRDKPVEAGDTDMRARWGIVLQMIAYAVVWQGRFWVRAPAGWRVGLSILFFALAAIISWTAIRTLGKQWRLDARLNADHQLVQTGVYAIVRHPIYTSMIFFLLAQGVMVAPWPLLIVAMTLMLIGTEIRVRVEEKLLRGRFTTQLDAYRRRVGAYIPKTPLRKETRLG
jgi:protein-S-isoprenylcysteine O-methyltransferase Ste14